MPIQFRNYEEIRLKLIAALCRGGSVLDVGFAQIPNRHFRGVHRVGLDLNPPKFRSDYEEEIVGDATRLGEVLGDRKFDHIVASEFIEHLENPYEFLRSVRFHLSERGELILSTPNPLSWPVIFFEALLCRRFFYTAEHLYYFTPRWMIRVLERSGFLVEKIVPVGLLVPLSPWRIPVPAFLSYQVIYRCRLK
jgi:hypothetical protein